jgi:hypothetical protein
MSTSTEQSDGPGTAVGLAAADLAGRRDTEPMGQNQTATPVARWYGPDSWMACSISEIDCTRGDRKSLGRLYVRPTAPIQQFGDRTLMNAKMSPNGNLRDTK